MKKVFGLTATQYVLRVRVDRAADLLVDTDHSIADIAAECGFSDQANLTRLFGRLIGETPARFRAAKSA
jgi:AraC family transcriptional regulator